MTTHSAAEHRLDYDLSCSYLTGFFRCSRDRRSSRVWRRYAGDSHENPDLPTTETRRQTLLDQRS